MHRHYQIDLVASAEYWTAAGYQVYRNTEVVGGSTIPDMDRLLLRGIEEAGRDHRAIVWAIGEHTRQKEERARCAVIAQEADAIQALARAITESTEAAALEKVLGRLTERTQHAVRAQLG